MVAYMDAEALRRTLETRPHLVLQPEPPGVLVQGRDLGRPPVRPVRSPTTATATRCSSMVDQEGTGACHTGEWSCFYRSLRRAGAEREPWPSRGFERFASSPRDYSVVPVLRGAARRHAHARSARSAPSSATGDGFLLESVEHGERWSRYSFLGRSPVADPRRPRRATSRSTTGELPAAVPLDQGILACLEALLDALPRRRSSTELPPLHGGLVGYLGYDVVREIERLGEPPPRRPRPSRRRRLGRSASSSPSTTGRAGDPRRQRRARRRRRGDRGDSEAALRAAYAALARAPREPAARPRAPGRRAARRRRPSGGARLDPSAVRRVIVSSAAYRAAVEVAKEYIRAGDAFQIVLSQRFDLDLGVDPFDVYRVLRQVNPSPYMFFLRQGGRLASSGRRPSRSSSSSDGRVISRPIAGTRPRGATDEEDRRLGAELVEHPKELAEHVMLVDLARNDVGRVVRFGTEQVDELMTLERYSHVMHLTSQVSGELVAGQGPDRRAAGDAARRHRLGRAEGAGDGDHRRARADQARARTPGSSATSTSPATSTPRSRSGPSSSAPTAGPRCRPAPASSPTATRRPRTPSARPRPQRSSRPPWRATARSSARCAVSPETGGAASLDATDRMLRSSAAAAWTTRDVVVVSGRDAISWLQGQLSQDVAAIGPGASAGALAALATGKGRCFLPRDDARSRAGPARHRRRGRRRAARAAAALQAAGEGRSRGGDRPDAHGPRPRCPRVRGRARARWPRWAIRGGDGLRRRRRGAAPRCLDVARRGGIDVLWPDLASAGLPAGPRAGAAEAFEAHRIEAGRPVAGRELDGRTIPQEVPGLVEAAVSFTKGCFTGQELVARLDARGGNVARHLRGLVLDDGPEVPLPGALLVVEGREVGQVDELAWSPRRGPAIALGYCHRNVAPGATVTVAPPERPGGRGRGADGAGRGVAASHRVELGRGDCARDLRRPVQCADHGLPAPRRRDGTGPGRARPATALARRPATDLAARTGLR